MGILTKATEQQKQKATSDWTSTPVSQEMKVALKKAEIDGNSVSLLLGKEVVASEVIDGNSVKEVVNSAKKRAFLSVLDVGGRGTIDTGNVVQVSGQNYRVMCRFSLNLEKC